MSPGGPGAADRGRGQCGLGQSALSWPRGLVHPTAVADVGRAARTKRVGGRAPLKPFWFRPVMVSKRAAQGCVTASESTTGTCSWRTRKPRLGAATVEGTQFPPYGQNHLATHHRFRGRGPGSPPPVRPQARLGGARVGAFPPPLYHHPEARGTEGRGGGPHYPCVPHDRRRLRGAWPRGPGGRVGAYHPTSGAQARGAGISHTLSGVLYPPEASGTEGPEPTGWTLAICRGWGLAPGAYCHFQGDDRSHFHPRLTWLNGFP